MKKSKNSIWKITKGGIPAILLFLALTPLSSHDMWVETKTPLVKAGQSLTMQFPSDHTFPPQHNEYIDSKEMAKTFLLTPSGKQITVEKKNGHIYRSGKPLRERGTHLIVSGKKWLYWTQTTDGWKTGKNKKQVKNPIKGVYSGKFVKSLINVDRPGGGVFKRRIGHTLEIIPLQNPAELEKGAHLECRILFKGKPYRGEVKATYAGFSEKENVFAVNTSTDRRGICKIKISERGPWLVKAGMRLPAPAGQKALCDEILYSATLTFQR